MSQSRHDIKHRWLVYLAGLAVGAVCVYGSGRLYRSVSRQPLALRVVSEETGGRRRMMVRLVNTGRNDLVVNVGGMGYFVAVLENDVREAVVQIQSETTGSDAGSGGRVIASGESLDIGDVFPVVRSLPAGRVVLRAVYTATGPDNRRSPMWRGVVHSPHLSFEVKRN